MYKEAGILNVRDFYQKKFSFPHAFDFTNRALNYYDIDNFKFLWVYANVKNNSRVLDFGCGSGSLACLKNKGCEITGIDYSEEALHFAKEINGYDFAEAIDLFAYDRYDYFDYVVSLDVFGHIPFEEKDRTIRQLKRFLKPGGTMLHGIECGNVDYAGMSREELQKFVQVDGHVGIEGKSAIIDRFKRSFNFVSGEVRHGLVESVGEVIKRHTSYAKRQWDEWLIEYLKILERNEISAFNLAAGLTQWHIENEDIPLPPDAEGFLLLKASDSPLVKQRIKVDRAPGPGCGDAVLANENIFCKGWGGVESNQHVKYRWSAGRAACFIAGCSGRSFQFEIFTGHPEVARKPVDIYFINGLNGQLIQTVTLPDHAPRQITIPVTDDPFILQVYCELTWVPALLLNSSDRRELGIGLANASLGGG